MASSTTPNEANRPFWGPTPAEARELVELARLGALAAGARGDDIDDVAQTAAEKLVVRWDEPGVSAARSCPDGGWRAYVFVTARNAFLDLGRSRRRATAREERVTRGTDGDPLPIRPGVRRPTGGEPSNVDAYLARVALVEIIESCDLPGGRGEVLRLSLVEGLSVTEIADRLGRSPRWVRELKVTGLDWLRQKLLDAELGLN